MLRFSGLLGIVVFLFIAYLLSSNKKNIPLRTVIVGIALQFGIAVFMLKTYVGVQIFKAVNKGFVSLLNYSNYGARFVFGSLVESEKIGAQVAFQVLPLIIFVSAVMGVLLYFGVIQFIIKILARLFYKTLNITGVEAFTSSLLIFMGIETITGVKDYIRNMNRSRLFTLMTVFMSTIAGSVMAAYVSFGAEAGHLLTASLMSAPAAIAISKIIIPDEKKEEEESLDKIKIKREENNVIEAVANGTQDGLNLALQVGAMLIAFVSIIYLLNDIVGLSGMTLEKLMGYLFSPVAFLIGISPPEAVEVGQLLGIKTVFNEFISYAQLQSHIAKETLSPRSIAIATYALCGFANFGSIGIILGGIGGIAPEKKPMAAQLAIKSLVAGLLAAFMTASVVSVLIVS
ncbi:NupC/NupG family nucleoside CNT transporter [bacterium]|nr:NupC/NupG family nucleoside CNT transporter [bacterium]